MTSRLDNMNLPPDLRTGTLGGSDIVRMYMRQFQEGLVINDKAPIGGDINEFFPLVHKTIISRQRADGIDDDKMVLFVEEDPPERLNTEAITFFIQSRSPGQYNQGPAGTIGHREVRHHIRGVDEHPEHTGEKLVTVGKFYDNYIRFNIYAKTNKQARKRLLWFTQLMDQYEWYFKMSGYLTIEQGVGDRQRIEIPEHGKVTKYPIVYFVKSEDLHHFGTQELKHIVFTADIESDV